MKGFTIWFILLVPVLVLAIDFVLDRWVDREATITCVVRCWAKESSWPEFVFLACAMMLYIHLFRGWPDGR